MKLIVQIPCLNEELTLPAVIADVPRQIQGIDKVEILIIDDGSTDRTVEVARELGVEHIVSNKRNHGLAWSFRRGMEASIDAGADIIVNTDGDNQYFGGDIPKLIAPILEGRADIVIGDRQTHQIAHFSPIKKLLQKLGSVIVGTLSGGAIPDTVSGFRALTREAAQSLNIVSGFSYTTEMLIQAGNRMMTVTSVQVRTNPQTRESRLFNSMRVFLQRSATTIVRTYAMYRPLRVFFFVGLALSLAGMAPITRFLWNYFISDGNAGHIQSLVLGGFLLMMGFISFTIGMLADLIAVNRQLLEKTLLRITKLEDAVRGNGKKSDTR